MYTPRKQPKITLSQTTSNVSGQMYRVIITPSARNAVAKAQNSAVQVPRCVSCGNPGQRYVGNGILDLDMMVRQ